MSAQAALVTRIGFVVELARRLHEYGTTAPRLEDAINLVAARLDLDCNVLSTPTSIVMSFSDLKSSRQGLAEVTQVVRLPPGEVNLKRLCQADEIADRVIEGQLDLAEGYELLRAFGRQRDSRFSRSLMVAAFGVASAAIALILRADWLSAGTAALIGVVIGAMALRAGSKPSVAAAFEALSALAATTIAIVVAFYIAPIAVRLVVIASLIVLMPGMSLTTAVRELSSQHLVSGTARLMGAVATLLKLAFGTVAATQLCGLFGITVQATPTAPLPGWVDWLAVSAGAVAFAVIFRAAWRHYPIVIGAVLLGYLCTRYGSAQLSPTFGAFIGGLVLGALSNIYARVAHRPGALVREPGIILLVPGSVGFSTVSLMLGNDVLLGLGTAITLFSLLIAIVAGLLFGDLLVPPRRKL